MQSQTGKVASTRRREDVVDNGVVSERGRRQKNSTLSYEGIRLAIDVSWRPP